MAKKTNSNAMREYLLTKPRKRTTFGGKKYATRKAYRGQGR